MRGARKVIRVAVGLILFTLTWAVPARAQQQFQATLTGAQQVPAVASSGTGFGTVVLNAAETQITVNLTFSGLTTNAIASHIHGSAAADANAGVLFDFTGVTPNATSGSIPELTFAITPAQVADLKAGLFYFNIHTTNFGGGEIRGQIYVTMTTTPSTLRVGATRSGATGPLLIVTQCQDVSVSLPASSAAWTAAVDQPWVQITRGSGSGSGRLTVCVSDDGTFLGAATSASATITLTASGINQSRTATVQLTVLQTGATAPPFGVFDTPAAGAIVSGSIPVTGWALDDIEVARVEIWRDRVPGETTPVYPGTGPGNGKIYIADPVFVRGARPDVETGYSAMPIANRAGWGYLLLTYGLWNQGNGTYTLYAFAYDKEGRSTTLGTKTITSNNAAATLPFGSIDTPGFGQTMSGVFINFGWALTPNATPTCTIPPNGVQVSIDSGPLQPVMYGDSRPDIAAAFPGYSNANNASGAYVIDSATLSNGPHQIGWYVVDNCGRSEGIGSRFFNVLNGSALVPTSEVALHPAGSATAINHEPVIVRRGGDGEVVWADPRGNRVVPLGQRDRIEVQLPGSALPYAGYQVVNGERRALPTGSSLDAAQGIFYWQPVAGFFAAHDLEFVSASAGLVRVRVVVGTSVQAVIDTPRPGRVSPWFVVAGWAIDEAASSGTGIDTVHVWAHPVRGGAPIFLGVAGYGDVRGDVGALFGRQFERSSFGLIAYLPPGTYDVVAYPHSVVAGDFHGAKSVRVTVPVR